MERHEWALLVLGAVPTGVSPFHLQTIAFLLGKGLSPKDARTYFRFVPSPLGPCSASLASEVEGLEEAKLVEIRRDDSSGAKTFALTVEGQRQLTRAREQLTSTLLAYLDEVVAWVRAHKLDQIVQRILEKYPDMRPGRDAATDLDEAA